MLKIIVTAAAILLPGTALAEDWGRFYAEVYGGAAIGTDSTYDSVDYAMGTTWAAGFAFGVEMPAGFSLGVDVMKTGDADYENESCCELTTFSVMAEGAYAVALNDSFSVYGSLGLGAINVAFSGDGEGDAWGAGYAAAVGVRANLTESMALFAEFKHQDTFSPVDINGHEISSPTNAALLGVRLSF